MGQIQIGFENRQDLIISKGSGPDRRWLFWCGSRFCVWLFQTLRLRLLRVQRGIDHVLGSGCVVFHEPRMALSAPCRLAIKVALHESTDFCLGLRQRHDVGPCVQLPLCVPADDLVLPEGEPFGISLIYCGNTDVGILPAI